MNDRNNIVVRRDDLAVMINAIENMLSSLNLLTSSLAGVIPEHILPEQLSPIAGNLISCCIPDLPYNIYTYSTETYTEKEEAEVRRFLLLIPVIPSIISDSLELDYVELRIEEETAEGDSHLELSFFETVTDIEKRRVGLLWEKLPESVRKGFILRFSPSGKGLILTDTTVKNQGGVDTQYDFFD